jgi:hypothetical protein
MSHDDKETSDKLLMLWRGRDNLSEISLFKIELPAAVHAGRPAQDVNKPRPGPLGPTSPPVALATGHYFALIIPPFSGAFEAYQTSP